MDSSVVLEELKAPINNIESSAALEELKAPVQSAINQPVYNHSVPTVMSVTQAPAPGVPTQPALYAREAGYNPPVAVAYVLEPASAINQV